MNKIKAVLVLIVSIVLILIGILAFVGSSMVIGFVPIAIGVWFGLDAIGTLGLI